MEITRWLFVIGALASLAWQVCLFGAFRADLLMGKPTHISPAPLMVGFVCLMGVLVLS